MHKEKSQQHLTRHFHISILPKNQRWYAKTQENERTNANDLFQRYTMTIERGWNFPIYIYDRIQFIDAIYNLFDIFIME